MGLSFEESMKRLLENENNKAASIAITPEVATMSIDEASIMTLDETSMIAAYSGDDGNWIQHPDYKQYFYYDENNNKRFSFSDDNISRITDEKEIKLDSKQINITQEENSQYIPFEMSRYYDGFDLTTTTISIHYDTNDGQHGASIPVNVTYNDEKIRFGWLVDAGVTRVAGKLKFEIRADGMIVDNEGNKRGYTWKTKYNEDLNVLKSLCGFDCNGVIEIDDSWVQELITAVAENVANQIAGVEVAGQVQAAQDAATSAQKSAAAASQSAASASNAAKTVVEEALVDYATIKYVDDSIAEIDVTDQLAEYAKSEDLNNYYNKEETNAYVSAALENYATDEDVTNAIAAADISSKLENYYTKEETYSKDDIDTALGNVTVDLTDYATKKFVTDKTDILSTGVSDNADDIKTLSGTVEDLQGVVNSIDTSPRLTYDVVYNDTEDPDVGENVFAFYEIENEGKEDEKKSLKQKFTIVGGSGSATSSALKIGYVTTSPYVITANDRVLITYTFSGTDSSGDAVTEGVAVWKVAGQVVATNTALGVSAKNPTGENTFDITEYVSVGTQKVNLTITDDAGSLVSKNWTVQVVDVRLESDFNDKLFYEAGKITFGYTPYGAISKDIHFILYDDTGKGTEVNTVTTSASGVPNGYELNIEEHGSHLLEVYMTSEINGNTIESNHIFKDIIVYESGNTTPIIGCVQQDFIMQQYDTKNVTYTIYDPSTETPSVEIADNDEVLATRTLIDSNTDVYPYKATDMFAEEETSRVHYLAIKCGETIKTLKVTVEKIDIDISPVTAGLVFDFNPLGKSNNDADRLWTNGTISMDVSDNFDWVNGGYQFDEDGDQYFCIKAGTSATIDYQLFADDAKLNGKEFKLIFKTTNVSQPNTTFLTCLDNTTDTNHIGIQMDVHEAFVYGQAGKLHLPYSEEDIIEFEFNISKNTEAIPMVMGYEDGVSTCPMIYGDSHDFTQSTPKIISLGSNNCDLHIYRFKVYNTSLTDRGILNNFIADARNAEEMIARYERNQIYDENQSLNPEILAEKCPWLRIIKVEAPHFTTGKKYPINNTTVEYIYKNGDPILDNWKATDCVHVGQGTSSDDYGASGRNMDLVLKSHKDFNNTPVITLSDGTIVNKVSLTRESVPVNYFNIKVNIASSENANNALLQRRYNEFNPYNRTFIREDGYDTSIIKDTMEFHNCVVFIKESDKDLSTHTEFADTDWHFYAIGNIGDSKKTDDTRLTDPNDRYECINEIVDVELPLSDFPVGDEAISIVEAEKFDKSGSYEWRYLWEDGTDEENAEVAEYCKQKWVDFYKFVVNSTDEEFKAHLGDYFVLDSALYYYLFTTRYTMVDNRAKNSFWHYGKTGEVDENGEPIRKWDLAFDYDNDTALGTNNYGDIVYRYGLEDTHVDENGIEVFRESDSTFFCRIRDLFEDELKTLYNTLENQNAWHGEGLINQFDEWQSEFPEELWRLDIERKYIRTYNSSHINGKGDDQFLRNMAHGKKKYQRRQYERNQEKYMASKYQSSVASSDANSVIIRCTVPDGDLAVQPNYSLTLTPYAYMYLNVQYSNGTIQVPIEELGVPITIPFSGDSTDIIKIYSAYSLQSIGDLSPLYAKTINASSASKLKELIIGNETEGYDNPYLNTLTTGANHLLEKLNIENVSGLTDPLNLSVLGNLRELYAHGSNIGGVTFADGGNIEIAELPAINAATMKNLTYLTTLDIADFSKLTALTVENCDTVDIIDILEKASNINRVRFTDIDWTLDDTSLLERLYAMRGIDKNGYNTDQSVLTGTVSVPTIGQQELYNYQKAWSDLIIVPTTIIPQFAVTFINEDGTVLDVQYINQFENAVDPITREENPIPIPTKDSTVQYDYTFDKWNGSLVNVGADRIITATYIETIRNYTIQYVSKGTVLKTEEAPYGSNIIYDGEIPTYTLEEPFKFYLFNRWDKSGFVNGDKTITAIFDEFQYTDGYFMTKELENFSPVEIYALTKLGIDNVAHNIDIADRYSFSMGYDIDFDDIESNEIISEKTTFSGTNYLDTGITLFDEDRDFVLALDYTISSNNESAGTFMQCFQSSGSNGFKLGYDGGSPEFIWGSSAAIRPSYVDNREVLVIRHKKGDNNLYVYVSNLDSTEFTLHTINKASITQSDAATLVFGAAKMDSGRIANYCMGDIYWCKIWYQDLGEKTCEQLVGWTHEEITLGVSGFYRYPLYDDRSKETMLSLVASHLLDRKMRYNTTNTNAGGWAESDLNEILNTRFYNAVPVQIKLLLKKMCVLSTIGQTSSTVSESGCYINIPSVYDVDTNEASYKNELYSGASTIQSMSTQQSRRREFRYGFDNDNVDAYESYWLRSPNTAYTSYVWSVNENYQTDTNKGTTSGFNTANTSHGVLIEISF